MKTTETTDQNKKAQKSAKITLNVLESAFNEFRLVASDYSNGISTIKHFLALWLQMTCPTSLEAKNFSDIRLVWLLNEMRKIEELTSEAVLALFKKCRVVTTLRKTDNVSAYPSKIESELIFTALCTFDAQKNNSEVSFLELKPLPQLEIGKKYRLEFPFVVNGEIKYRLEYNILIVESPAYIFFANSYICLNNDLSEPVDPILWNGIAEPYRAVEISEEIAE